jgi:signal peptidase I
MSNPRHQPPSRESLLRQVIEFFACLVIAVTLFKTFETEGYLISTGSMAPTLLGYHKQVTCPSCHYPFALGISQGRAPALAVCPNCDQYDIDVRGLPQNDGDQLLVHKTAYAWRPPQRWEVVVFRNPQKPTEAYVKRVVGLPGEKIEIRGGDVYADGKIRNKPLRSQQGLRISVYDDAFRPPATDPDWQPRWIMTAPWKADDAGYTFEGGKRESGSEPPSIAWMTYRHWIRAGGNHVTGVPLQTWPAELDLAALSPEPLWFDADQQRMVYRGAMSAALRDRLRDKVPDPEFQRAIQKLYDDSHVTPVTDRYAYNRLGFGNGGLQTLRDFMLSLEVAYLSGTGEFRVEMTDGTEAVAGVFDFTRNEVRLEPAGGGKPLRTAALPAQLRERPAVVELSLMDCQALLAVDGKMVFEPWTYEPVAEPGPAPRRPVRLGARNLRLQVRHLQLFRDIYYTPDGGRGVTPYSLKNLPDRQEYFALGDNSPVSVDSRLWPNGRELTTGLFLGKPFLVHLPARTGRVELGPWKGQIRIPDISRIRYIR